jgi:hypothetical protein
MIRSYLLALVCFRHVTEDGFVKTTWAQESRVDEIGAAVHVFGKYYAREE